MSRPGKSTARFVSLFCKTVIVGHEGGSGTVCRRVLGGGYRGTGWWGGARVLGYWVRGGGCTGTGYRVWVLHWPGYCTGLGYWVLYWPGLLYWPGYSTTGLGTVLAWVLYCLAEVCGVPAGLTTAGILRTRYPPSGPDNPTMAAIVALPAPRLPQPQKECSKRLPILPLLRNFKRFYRPSRPKVFATYTRMVEILSSRGEDMRHIRFNPNCCVF